MDSIGQLVRRGRERAGLGQGDLAERLGVRQQTVSRWEVGLAVPRASRVRGLAEVLDLPVVDLLRAAGYDAAVQPAVPPVAPPPTRPAPQPGRSARWHELATHLPDLDSAELIDLIDSARRELRARERPVPPAEPRDAS